MASTHCESPKLSKKPSRLFDCLERQTASKIGTKESTDSLEQDEEEPPASRGLDRDSDLSD